MLPARQFVFALLAAVLAASAASADPDLGTAGMQELKRALEKEQAVLHDARQTRLKDLLEQTRRDAAELFNRKKVAGNIAGMAAARTAMKILDRSAARLADTGDFEVPGDVRYELTAMMKSLRREKEAVDAEHRVAVAALKKTYAARLNAQLRSQGQPTAGPERAGALLEKLLESGDVLAPGATEDQTGAGEGESDTADAEENRRQEIAVSSPGSNWVTAAFWDVETYGLEIVRLPTARVEEDETRSGGGMISGHPYEAVVRPVRVLPEADLYAFRINRLRGTSAADVLEWPHAGNDRTLSLRVRPAGELPASDRFELQVSGPGTSLLPKAGEEAVDMTAIRQDIDVSISIDTQPQGALVYVDRQLVRQNQEPVRTPCTITVKGGLHQIVLRKRGHLDAVLNDVEATQGLRLTWNFKENPAYEQTAVRVSARSVWQQSGLDVRAGDRLLVKASGTWSCGNKKEEVDADGYPNNAKYFHYYFDPASSPRQLAGAPYGALLMRIGESGRPVMIGRARKLTVTESGRVLFDVNEAADARYRRDNRGYLTVEIHKLAGSR